MVPKIFSPGKGIQKKISYFVQINLCAFVVVAVKKFINFSSKNEKNFVIAKKCLKLIYYSLDVVIFSIVELFFYPFHPCSLFRIDPEIV